ncbi:MAG: response regulator [Elusimicrobiota bacterium]|nr:response regulator [Elusimicrobiota bacterium]
MARILIADDEESIRDLVKEVLSADGHEFLLAENGTRALELLKSKGADLAIIDRNMPGLSGIEVVQAIRLNPKLAKVRILMCTAASVTKEIDEAFAAGADDYVLKPLNFQALLAKVAKALAKT